MSDPVLVHPVTPGGIRREDLDELVEGLRSGGLDASIRRGATRKQLTCIVHLAQIDRDEWFHAARTLRLSGRHAGHIIARLNEIKHGTAELEDYLM